MNPNPFVTVAVLVALIAAGPGCDRPTQAPSSSASPSSPAPASASSSLAVPAAVDSGAALESGARSDRGVSATGTRAANAVTFDNETAGDPSPSFEEVVGDWYVADRAGARGLVVDGSKWRNGTPSANLADQAKHLYGDRYAEFLDGVKGFAFFPLAIWNGEPPAGDARIAVRFYPFAGKVDQAAGIAFAIAPDGSYLGIRANALEDNLLYFKVVKGRRTVFDDVRSVSTPSQAWHALVVELRGRDVSATIDGQKRFEKTLDSAPSGRIGLWSKADSQVLFDDFRVESLGEKAE
jgi:hypothetical protein